MTLAVPVSYPERPQAATASGAEIWFAYPERTPIRARDLRLQLPRIIRYNGTINVSLLLHSALVAELARALAPDSIEAAGAHDLHEIYVGDVHTVLKLGPYRDIENDWERRVHEALGVTTTPSIADVVKRLDLLALAVEMSREGHAMANVVIARDRERYTREELRVGLGIYGMLRELGPNALWRVLCRAIPFHRLEDGEHAVDQRFHLDPP